MGCQNSKDKGLKSDSVTGANITKKSKKIVQDMWLVLKPDSRNFGVTLFVRMFEDSPSIQDLFYDFKDLKDQNELVQSLKELDHVARVMNSFGNCVELLDDVNQFTNTVQRLGAVHIKIGIQPEHLTIFGRILLESLAEYCGSSWTKEKERAWKEFMSMLAANFVTGLRGENILASS